MKTEEMKPYLEKIESRLEKMKQAKVAILGDICIDEYIYGSVRRINPEAPVPIVEYERELLKPGMGGNVATNISDLGAKVTVFGVMGDGKGADELESILANYKNINNCLIRDKARPTIRKTRILAANQHVVRVDREEVGDISSETQKRVLVTLEKEISHFDVLIIQEHAKGLFTETLAKEVFKICKENGVSVLVDPNKSSPPALYKGVELMTPNLSELLHFCEIDPRRTFNLEEIAEKFRKETELSQLLVTLGSKGMLILDENSSNKIPTFAREVFEVSGAGDTVIAFLAMGRASGCSLTESAIIANIAASVVCGKIGTSTATQEEIIIAARDSV